MPRKKKLPRHVRRHGPGFRAVVIRDGHRNVSPTFATADKASAWAIAAKAELQLPPDISRTITLAEGLALIIEDLAQTGGRKATETFYRNHARILFAGIGGGARDLADVRTADLRRYIDARRKTGVAPQTITGKELFVLRRIRKLAAAEGFIVGDDPFVGLRTPKARTGRFDVLTQERVAELVRKMRERQRGRSDWHADLVELLFATGIRRAELERLRVDDIDRAAMRLSIDGKTGHRYQPFGKSLLPVLDRLAEAAQRDGHLIRSFRTVEKLFSSWQKRLAEPRFAAHVLRHSYATAMASRVGPYELMALMGHASLTQTSRYYHGRGAAVRAALDTLRLDQPPPPHA